jgi:exopolyphosphatase/guanosine-5'-triphosphate,3'-diphosphate pyrophosphatase
LTPPGAVQDSDELYFIGGYGANVKVRDDLMDIKVLQEIGADGLERWEPIMKKAFPLPAADAAKVFASLHLTAPQLARDAYTLDQFVGELVMPSRVLRSVSVQKRRVRYAVVGCISELTDVQADGKTTRTIAIEAEDPAAVSSAVASVGLAGYLNTNYMSGLQAPLDGTPER